MTKPMSVAAKVSFWMVVLGVIASMYVHIISAAVAVEAKKPPPPTFEIWCPEARLVVESDPGTLRVKEGVLAFKSNGKEQYIIGERCFAFEK